MKIFILEDDSKSIESAKEQFKGHELYIYSSVAESRSMIDSIKCGNEKPDMILSDMYVPMGDMGSLDVAKRYESTAQFPAGFVVIIQAMKLNIPCFLITDSNSHKDPLGLLLDSLRLWDDPYQNLFIITRPYFLNNGAKDWLSSINRSDLYQKIFIDAIK